MTPSQSKTRASIVASSAASGAGGAFRRDHRRFCSRWRSTAAPISEAAAAGTRNFCIAEKFACVSGRDHNNASSFLTPKGEQSAAQIEL